MYDKPSLEQLLDAVRVHLQKNVLPVLEEDRRAYVQTQVAINVLNIVEREVQMSLDQMKAEWKRIDFVQGKPMPMPADPHALRAALYERNRKVCEEIEAGRYDYAPQRSALFEHLLVTARAQLEVAHPSFLQALAVEDQNKPG